MIPFLIAVTALSLAAWAYLVLGHGMFWTASVRLPGGDTDPPEWPAVAAVVPARDEAAFIGRAVRSLAGQDYPGEFAIVVVDDSSGDGTADAARAAAPDGCIEVVRGAGPPPGWTGKLWALDQGVRRAADIAPDAAFLWFTDADIEHAPDALRRLVRRAEADGCDLVSLMVRLNCESGWERLLIPAFVFFFQKLYPFRRVNDARSRTAGAAGGCMLVRRAALNRIGGLAAIRGDLIDDCALARAIKPGGGIWLGLTASTRSIRPYPALGDIWSMVARTAFHQLGYSATLLAGAIVGMALLYLAPPLAVLGWPAHGDGTALALGAASWVLMTVVYGPTLRLYGLSPVNRLLLPVAALFYVAMTADSARRHWSGRGGAWKARYHAPGGGTVG